MLENEYICANWNAPSNIKTLITKRFPNNNHRLGFNLATHVNDGINQVLRNRQELSISLPSAPYWILQTHSNNVLEIDKLHRGEDLSKTPCNDNLKISSHQEYVNFDAAITHTKNKVCVVLTADCIPVLLTDRDASFVASIHAGRVGVATNIITNTINKAEVSKANMIAYIGPAICANHYEVGSDIYAEFSNLNQQYKRFFMPKNTLDKFNLDLTGIAILQLLECGLSRENIYSSKICTYCQHERFYSYRQDKNTGRFASLIWIS